MSRRTSFRSRCLRLQATVWLAALVLATSRSATAGTGDIVELMRQASRPAQCLAGDGIALKDGHVVAAVPYRRMQGFARAAGTSGGLGRQFFPVWRDDDQAAGSGTLRAAVDQARRSGGGWIGFVAPLTTRSAITLRAPLRLPANVTIDGGCIAPVITAPPQGSIVYIQRTENVVLLRLRLAHASGAIDGKRGGDCVTVSHGTDRVWIGFSEMSHCTDGLVDITQSGVDAPMRITVSQNYFHNHDKAILISGDHCLDTGARCDAIALIPRPWSEGVHVTLLENVFEDTGQRHPRVSGRAYADVAGTIVAFRPQARVSGGQGGSYGAFAANGGMVLVRDSLFLAVDPQRAKQAFRAADPLSPGAMRIEGVVTDPAQARVLEGAPTMVADPPYRLDALPAFARDAQAAVLCVAGSAGVGGWDRAPRQCGSR